MVGVIVNVTIFFGVDTDIEATLHALEGVERLRDGIARHTDAPCGNEGGGGVQHIVDAGEGHDDLELVLTFALDVEHGVAAAAVPQNDLVFAVVAETVSDFVPSLYLKTFPDDDIALGEFREVVETLNEMLLITVDVQMVGIDGADDADVGVELQEGAVELIGLDHEDAVFGLA